ncbi:L-histidine N(alpha)-methyltransferase [Ottowia thiooxydans]|uniref:L-histidine N(alpha)-methyltransferase n=1 Tax=Ottowia thiooxydans TaxID=219182 RepID=UPI00041135EF|nr:L-histidine N(alpha)-methyltransferase [Ottowia thiooxydans]
MEQEEIISGLMQPVPRISPKYFYDQLGSKLFEAITRLPEYYPTRTEKALLEQQAADIKRLVGEVNTVIEPGAGNVEKARMLCQILQPKYFVGVDISAEVLKDGIDRLRHAQPTLDARAVIADLTNRLDLPEDIPMARRLVFYPGSSIGNYDPPQALEWLHRARSWVDATGGLLIGVDLPKEVAVLEAAYDDAAGTTARFNRNILAHVNTVIGSDFDPSQWSHRAFFNPVASRIEMHLQAEEGQRVRWPGGGREFAHGERIHTENSYKYALPVFMTMLREAGFAQVNTWTDERGWYALLYAQP